MYERFCTLSGVFIFVPVRFSQTGSHRAWKSTRKQIRKKVIFSLQNGVPLFEHRDTIIIWLLEKSPVAEEKDAPWWGNPEGENFLEE